MRTFILSLIVSLSLQTPVYAEDAKPGLVKRTGQVIWKCTRGTVKLTYKCGHLLASSLCYAAETLADSLEDAAGQIDDDVSKALK